MVEPTPSNTESRTKFCMHCGAQIAFEAEICPKCGVRIAPPPRSQDSLGERLFFFLSGIIVGVPVALFFELVSHLWFTALGIGTIVAPIIEEFAKADPLFYRYHRTGRSLMRFGLLSGLGFGLAEAFIYIQAGTPFLLRVPAIAFHAAGTSIVAYGVYKHKVLKYYFLAVTLHFLNNFFAALGWLWLIGGLGATVASYYLAWKFYRQVSKPI